MVMQGPAGPSCIGPVVTEYGYSTPGDPFQNDEKCWEKLFQIILLGIMKNLHHGLWGNFHVIVEQKAEI